MGGGVRWGVWEFFGLRDQARGRSRGRAGTGAGLSLAQLMPCRRRLLDAGWSSACRFGRYVPAQPVGELDSHAPHLRWRSFWTTAFRSLHSGRCKNFDLQQSLVVQVLGGHSRLCLASRMAIKDDYGQCRIWWGVADHHGHAISLSGEDFASRCGLCSLCSRTIGRSCAWPCRGGF